MSTPEQIKKLVKAMKYGKSNVTKDFLPLSSQSVNIKRPLNSRSRKCTIIWLDKFEDTLRERILRGMYPNERYYRDNSVFLYYSDNN